MYTRAEKFFKGFDGTKLFLQTWQKKEAIATVFITHGWAEHSDCYQRLIHGLEKHVQLNFIAWDLRGHGKSDGIRGYAADFNDYALDYDLFITEAKKIASSSLPEKPLFILAHSMGGLIQTIALAKNNYSFFKAQILSSPFFGASFPIPIIKSSAAGLLNKFLPKLTLSNDIKREDLTRDLDIIAEYEKDNYRHNKASAGVFLGAKREHALAIDYAEQITLPTYMSISDHDPVVSTEAALAFFNSLSSKEKTLKIIDGAKHELYNDSCRDEVFKSISEFCSVYLN
jgi:lysophospholipase